jgi:protein SCO1
MADRITNQTRNPVARWGVMVLVVVAAVAAGWYIGSRAGSDPAETTPDATRQAGVYRDVAGRVVRLAPEEGTVTVDHEAIEGLMAAMVMDFEVVDPAELRDLSPGDPILFDLVRIGDAYQAVRFRRPGVDGGGADAGAEAAPPADALGPGDLLPDLVLFDADGQRFRLHEMAPRHKLITFFYARCPLENFCPAQATRLSQLQQHIEQSGSELHLVSLTLDAEHDGLEVLRDYARHYAADPTRWTLAGGEDPAAVREFAHRAGARIYAHADSYVIDHALVALRVDGNRIVDRVYGLEAIEKLTRGM